MQFTMTLAEKEAGVPPKSYTLNITKDLVPMHIFSETPQGTNFYIFPVESFTITIVSGLN